ncbi:DUF6129 family protein [Dechloromonas sp. H13]|uniref:DUF6129 family protein n=1 Tax=Dechloromonas sp. H13 TaxID=2570193 RepID=UPI0012920B1E|nr:DUF6129 family protein [Dechloromonas sp. H13]
MITPTQLAQVGEATLLDARAASLRQRFPGMHFTECGEDDVSPRYRPAFSVDGYDLYLISGASGHCLELTNDPGSATGILVAAKVDEE